MELLNPLKLYKSNLKLIFSKNVGNPVNKSFNTDSVYWYNHQEKVYEVGTIYNAFKCKKCDEVFNNKSEFMYHKKAKHRNYVPDCRNNLQGTCWFDKTKSWFTHDNINAPYLLDCSTTLYFFALFSYVHQ